MYKISRPGHSNTSTCLLFKTMYIVLFPIKVMNTIGNTLNINDRYYETLPEEKVNIINDKKKNGNIVYVGDGVNDAPCLLNATVGISMKSLGSDIAVSAL